MTVTATERPAAAATVTSTASPTAVQAGLTAAAAASLVAATIHAAVAPEHQMEYAAQEGAGWLPLAFAVSAVFGLMWAGALVWFGYSRPWLYVGAAGFAAMAGVGIWSRTVGFGEVEAPSAIFLTALGAELAGLVLCALLLTQVPRLARFERDQVAPRMWWLIGLGLAAVAVTYAFVGGEAIDHARMLGRLPFKYIW